MKYLDEKPQIKKNFLHFDNDNAGRKASLALKTILPSQYEAVSYKHLDVYKRQVQENPLNDHLKVAKKQPEEKEVEYDIGMGYLCLLYTSRCV